MGEMEVVSTRVSSDLWAAMAAIVLEELEEFWGNMVSTNEIW
jgi:hypothetical protein